MTLGGAVLARAAPARVVTIVSTSDSLESASADMEIDGRYIWMHLWLNGGDDIDQKLPTPQS